MLEIGNWWQGQDVLISPRFTQSIRWTEHLIYLGVNRSRTRTSPEHDGSRPIATSLETAMVGHHGPTKPADAARAQYKCRTMWRRSNLGPPEDGQVRLDIRLVQQESIMPRTYALNRRFVLADRPTR